MILFLFACTNLNSDEDAERAYMGLDLAVEKALNLGLQGYNAADSANIDDQGTEGEISGTMIVGGKVDQGSSDNKGLRLEVTLEDYADFGPDDDLEIVYATDSPAALDISLRDMPDGTFTGTLVGTFVMDGQIEGGVALDLALSGETESDGGEGLQRVEGTTTIEGSAGSEYGDFDVDLTR